MENYNNPNIDATQSESFDINLASGYLSGYLPYKSIEDFNIKETGKGYMEEKIDEPFFGENIREAKAVLKGIFER